MRKSKPKVFLDANVVISAGKPPGGLEFSRVIDLVEAGLVTVLTTDLTIIEVAKKHAQNDFDVIKDICQPHFRSIVQEVAGVALPEMKRTELRKELRTKYDASTSSLFKKCKAKSLGVDEVKPSIVFDAYASGEGFFAGDGKKDQFPDAFIFERLKQESSIDTPVIIVSNDGDFEGPVAAEKHISLVKSLTELFTALGLVMEAPKIEQFIEERQEELVGLVNEEVNEWGLNSEDVEDAEFDEIVVNSIDVGKLTAFRPTDLGDPILVVGSMDAHAYVSFTHPNWQDAMYDSEDKRLIPFEDVSGEADVEIPLKISMSITVDVDDNPIGIEDLRIRNNGLFVTLYPPEDLW